jgi:regulator of RNase E activity RraA
VKAGAIQGVTGPFVPPELSPASFSRAEPSDLDALRRIPGVSAAVSDALERHGLASAVAASVLTPRHRLEAAVVGHAVTLRYLPQRLVPDADEQEPRLAHGTAVATAAPGDVLVIDAGSEARFSCFGGVAGTTARAAGIQGVVLDGAARDLDEIESAGLPLWSAHVTPVTGNRRLEAVAINHPVRCGGVQVRAGDVVVADSTGVCFVPPEVLADVIARVVDASAQEAGLMAGRSAEQS